MAALVLSFKSLTLQLKNRPSAVSDFTNLFIFNIVLSTICQSAITLFISLFVGSLCEQSIKSVQVRFDFLALSLSIVYSRTSLYLLN